MPFDVASALLLTYGTSQHALKDRAKLKAGETLLVLGAAGGVGLAAVELGKATGARVIGAVSTQEKADFVKSRGADDCIIYPTGPFDKDGAKALADLFKKACGKDGANVIYDAVGGDYSEASLRAIAWEGRFLVVGFPAGIAKLPLNLDAAERLRRARRLLGRLGAPLPAEASGECRRADGSSMRHRQDQPAYVRDFPAREIRRCDRLAREPQGDGQGRGDDGLKPALILRSC